MEDRSRFQQTHLGKIMSKMDVSCTAQEVRFTVLVHSIRNELHVKIVKKYCSWKMIHVSLLANMKWMVVLAFFSWGRKGLWVIISMIWQKVQTFFQMVEKYAGEGEIWAAHWTPLGKDERIERLRDWDTQLDNAEIDPLSWNMGWELGRLSHLCLTGCWI